MTAESNNGKAGWAVYRWQHLFYGFEPNLVSIATFGIEVDVSKVKMNSWELRWKFTASDIERVEPFFRLEQTYERGAVGQQGGGNPTKAHFFGDPGKRWSVSLGAPTENSDMLTVYWAVKMEGEQSDFCVISMVFARAYDDTLEPPERFIVTWLPDIRLMAPGILRAKMGGWSMGL